jgi:pimeloyl-ACP methyl ester carboxylesterase
MGVHLVVLIHGLYGSPNNLAVIHEELVKAADADVCASHNIETVVHVCKSFTGSHTWDGIDVNAWKASQEVDEVIERLEGEGREVERFSVFGYSLGGCEWSSLLPPQRGHP